MTKQEFEIWTKKMKEKLLKAIEGAKEMQKRTEDLNKEVNIFFRKSRS